MPEIQAPDYRVRLFLSVDLTGSTDFKSKSNSTAWLKAFQRFYGDFPKTFISAYYTACANIPQIDDIERENIPKVWKTIGDEILFVNRVHSLCHVSAYITAFVEALKQFGQDLHSSSGRLLNTKGNAWIAAFPSPNCSIRLSLDELDPLNGTAELPSEASELKVDQDPRLFDFLGKGIDGGFRIARNSTVNTLTVSPGLAFLLSRAHRNVESTKFTTALHFEEMQTFKGVANGEPYPIITIDTTREDKRIKLISCQRKVYRPEMELNYKDFQEYLEEYLDFHGIECPKIKVQFNNNSESPPPHYVEYLKEWSSEYDRINKVQIIETSGGGEEGAPEQGNTQQEILASIDDALQEKT